MAECVIVRLIGECGDFRVVQKLGYQVFWMVGVEGMLEQPLNSG